MTNVNILSCLLFFSSLVFGLVAQNTLPPKFSIAFNGNGSDPAFPHVYRDGGVSGVVSGKKLMVFCDTKTTTGNISAPMTGFTSNSIAYVGSSDSTVAGFRLKMYSTWAMTLPHSFKTSEKTRSPIWQCHGWSPSRITLQKTLTKMGTGL